MFSAHREYILEAKSISCVDPLETKKDLDDQLNKNFINSLKAMANVKR